jgi:hypothetical protein
MELDRPGLVASEAYTGEVVALEQDLDPDLLG